MHIKTVVSGAILGCESMILKQYCSSDLIAKQDRDKNSEETNNQVMN